MRGWIIIGILGLSMNGIGIGGSQGCFPTSPNPATVNTFSDPLTGNLYYIEVRGSSIPTSPPLPGSGLLLGQGTWVYQETNGLWDLQRGGVGAMGTCFPPMPPCLLVGQDPLTDVNCGAG